MKNPLREVFDFKRQELPIVALLFAFFFLVIAVFQMLYPLKKGLFVEEYGKDVELYAKLANILVAALGVMVFTFLYNKLRRQQLIYIICAFFAACFVLLSNVLTEPGALSIWGFYLLGDLFTTLLVAGFWAYSTDISTSDQAKRLFGVIGAGGVIAGVTGVGLTKLLLERIEMQGLLLLAAAMMGLIVIVIFNAESLISRSGVFKQAVRSRLVEKEAPKKPSAVSAAIEGAQLVMRSRYLVAIVGIMTFYEMASQLMDYQFTAISEGFEGVVATQAFLADIRFYATVLSVVVQIFLVSFIMRRLGLVVALLVLPLAIIGSSAAFFAVSTLYVGSLLHISDNGLNYSIQQTSRESLYVVTTPDEKYKARAFTNMFVQRLGKGLSILAVMGLGTLGVQIKYLSLLTIPVAVGMVLCSVYAGRQFGQKSAREEEERQAA